MIFVDTSGWLALADAHDRDHARARALEPRIAKGEFGKLVTTNYVLTETLTILRRRMGLPGAIRFARGLTSSEEVRVFWIEPVHHREAMQLMESHTDKTWSLTDCSSFVVMKGLGIENAFAVDNDFAQAGFQTYPQD